MNQLPRVLQNEIWEYVRGDRAYWRRCYQQVMDDFLVVIAYAEQHMHCTTAMISRVDLLFRYRESFIDRTQWTRFTPAFMKYQHQVHGQLFADNFDEYQEQRHQWIEWCHNFNPDQ